MKTFTIPGFKYGLDTRREVLARLPGTLVQCENAHITQGGEIQKRKAFVRLGPIDADGLTLGLETTGAGVTTFGGADGALLELLPGVTYVRLTHPAVTEGQTYDPGIHQVTEVISSTAFSGKSLVAAKFADGNTFLYYDGVVVAQSWNGLVLSGLNSLNSLASELAVLFNGLQDWVALPNVEQNGNAQDGTVVVKSPALTYYTPIADFTSTNGQLASFPVDRDIAAVAGTVATASFKVTQSSAGTFTITAPATQAGTGVAELTAGSVTTAASATLTAVKLVQIINDLSYAHGYTALNNADTVSVYAPASWGASANGFNLTVNVTGGAGTAAPGTLPTQLQATITPSPVLKTGHVFGTGGVPQPKVQATITAAGGTGPYTYAWSENVPGSGSGMTITNGTTVTPSFGIDMTQFSYGSGSTPLVLTGTFKCVVTDSVAATITVLLNVTFTYTLF